MATDDTAVLAASLSSTRLPDVETFDTRAIQQRDAAHFLHPFTDHAALRSRGARVIVRGQGVYLWDSEGKQLIDGMSGLWCVNVGYGRTSISQAVYRQMETLPFYNSFFNTTNVPAVELATELVALAPPQFSHVFFTGSGSEANDTVVRMVRRYWDVMGQPARTVIISRHNAYHGSTMAGASLGGMAGMHAQGGLPIPDIVHIGQPNYAESGHGMSEHAFGLRAAGWLEEQILASGPERVAAFIGEPVQGAGGVIIPPETYWPEVQRICDKYGILLIADEVICGFGRLGTMFGSELMGMRPDLISFAKGVTSGYVPLGGVLVGKRVAQALIERGGDFNHGFTYSGHPVACAAGLATLDIYREEGLLTRAADLADDWAAAMHDLRGRKNVIDIRTIGLIAGIELAPRPDAPGKRAYELFVDCFQRGLLTRVTGDIIALSPPLILERGQIGEIVEVLGAAIDRVA